MRWLLIFLLALFLFSSPGCSLMAQSNAAHKAIEARDYDVDRVVVKVADEKKTVVVVTVEEVDEKGRKEIKAAVLEEIPDADEIRIKKAKRKRRKDK